jgi:hypothetical protein
MKLLVTIQNVSHLRSYQRPDGTYSNVYGVTMESGDDTIFAETFFSLESQMRRGIVAGSIGTASISMGVRTWTDREGRNRTINDIRLQDFALANRNYTPQSAENSTTLPPKDETAAESPAAPKTDEIKPDCHLPF